MRRIFKWIGRIIIGLIVLVLLLGALTWFQNKAMEPPSIEDAPWAVQTFSNDEFRVPSRIYYAETIERREDGTWVLINYWDYDGKRYHHHKAEKPFPLDLYGNIQIVRRGQ